MRIIADYLNRAIATTAVIVGVLAIATAKDQPVQPVPQIECIRLKPSTPVVDKAPIIPARWCVVRGDTYWRENFIHAEGASMCVGLRRTFPLTCENRDGTTWVLFPEMNEVNRFVFCNDEFSGIEELELVDLDTEDWCIRMHLTDAFSVACSKFCGSNAQSVGAIVVDGELMTLGQNLGGCMAHILTHRSYEDSLQLLHSLSPCAKAIRLPAPKPAS